MGRSQAGKGAHGYHFERTFAWRFSAALNGPPSGVVVTLLTQSHGSLADASCPDQLGRRKEAGSRGHRRSAADQSLDAIAGASALTNVFHSLVGGSKNLIFNSSLVLRENPD